VPVGGNQFDLPQRQPVDRVDGDDINDATRRKAGTHRVARDWSRTGAAASSEQQDYRETGGQAHNPIALIQTALPRKNDAGQ
jgi:hypothetical protein